MDNGVITLAPVARIISDFPQKFGIPRQSGLVEALEARVVFLPEYRNPDMLRELERYTHIWLLWGFSEAKGWSPTVRPPRLGGNTRVGVFASRSPFRPNPIGISAVRLLEIEHSTEDGAVLRVAGADLESGTPIYDIKPYLPYVDSKPEASNGFALANGSERLTVNIPQELLQKIPAEKREALAGVLSQDPRPQYQNDPQRRYTMSFAGLEVSFRVERDRVEVEGIEETQRPTPREEN